MEAVGNHFLTPGIREEVRTAKQKEAWSKIGVIALGVLLIGGVAGGVALTVWGGSIAKENPNKAVGLLLGGLLGGIVCLGFSSMPFIFVNDITKVKEKIREMAKRPELSGAQRFELYSRNQHRFTPKEFYAGALKKVFTGEWNILGDNPKDKEKALIMFRQSFHEYLDNPLEVNTSEILKDALNSNFLRKHAPNELKLLITTFGPNATQVDAPIPFDCLIHFPLLTWYWVAPERISQLNRLGEGKKSMMISLADCTEFDFDDLSDLSQITNLEIANASDLNNVFQLMQKCPNLKEVGIHIPIHATQDQLQEFFRKLPVDLSKVELGLPLGIKHLDPLELPYKESFQTRSQRMGEQNNLIFVFTR